MLNYEIGNAKSKDMMNAGSYEMSETLIVADNFDVPPVSDFFLLLAFKQIHNLLRNLEFSNFVRQPWHQQASQGDSCAPESPLFGQ